jgi:hypothetical protein
VNRGVKTAYYGVETHVKRTSCQMENDRNHWKNVNGIFSPYCHCHSRLLVNISTRKILITQQNIDRVHIIYEKLKSNNPKDRKFAITLLDHLAEKNEFPLAFKKEIINITIDNKNIEVVKPQRKY